MKDESGQGWIRAVPTEQVGRYMKELIEFLDGRHPEIAKTIAEKKALDDGIRKSLDAALKEFRGIFQAEA
jgi:F-type H+-transporting ATPase subunit alpha